MSDYITISTDTGLFNAGIVGLIKMLNNLQVDYKMEEQFIKVPKSFFMQENLAEFYLDTIFEKFKDTNRFGKLINIDFANCDEKVLENYNSLFKNKTAATICATYSDTVFIPLTKAYTDIPKNDIEDKRIMGETIKEYLTTNYRIYRYIVIGDATREELGLFFGTVAYLKISQGNCLIEKGKVFEDSLNAFIFDKLREFVASYEDHLEDNKHKCLQCRDISFKNRNLTIDMKFLNNFVDDPGKKKSTFWNNVPDSYLCPICAFAYMMMPFGFVEVQGRNFRKDKLFINENNSVDRLFKVNSSYKEIKQDEDLDKYKIISAIVMDELEAKNEYELNNIELIIRENFDKKAFYSYAVIGGDILEVIRKAQNYLKPLVRRKVKLKDGEYIDIFPEVLNNILNNANQWNFIQRLLRLESVDINMVDNILRIQILQNNIKEADMKVIDKKIISAKMSGLEMKRFFGVEAENKLRSYVYKLVNALSTGNRDMFLDAVTRMYSGINKEIPSVFINVFSTDESFKEIGYAYILGLKTTEYKEKEKTV